MLSKTQIRQNLLKLSHKQDGVAYIHRHIDLLLNKYRLVSKLQPESICEIGVRTGYSMLMFIHAVDHNDIVGIDNASSEHGGFDGAVFHAVKHLPRDRWSLWIKDSQTIENCPFQAEFWHIDGNHSVRGTWHDLSIAFNNGCKWALVDDYGRITETKQGTNEYLDNNSDTFHTEMVDEYQLLITRKD